MNGIPLPARDSAVMRDEAEVVMVAREDAELLLVEAVEG
jgi:hypothetical protein